MTSFCLVHARNKEGLLNKDSISTLLLQCTQAQGCTFKASSVRVLNCVSKRHTPLKIFQCAGTCHKAANSSMSWLVAIVPNFLPHPFFLPRVYSSTYSLDSKTNVDFYTLKGMRPPVTPCTITTTAVVKGRRTLPILIAPFTTSTYFLKAMVAAVKQHIHC